MRFSRCVWSSSQLPHRTRRIRPGTPRNRCGRGGPVGSRPDRKESRTPFPRRARPKNADTPIPANPFAIAALRFLILTGWREGEALGLRWDQVDFARGIAALPDTKTGRSDRHIGAPALPLLSDLPRLADSPFVFPGAKPGTHLVEIKRVWEAVRFAAKLEGVRLHAARAVCWGYFSRARLHSVRGLPIRCWSALPRTRNLPSRLEMTPG